TELEIPATVTHVAVLENGCLQSGISRREYDLRKLSMPPVVKQGLSFQQEIPEAYYYDDFITAVKMVNTNVTYGNKRILHDINWEVKQGECWRVAGSNGSGKST
ncbi:hypothetical protein LZ318_28550, partial [Saccharopolyspora indica]